MELELGLKFTRVADGLTSDVHVAKDRANPMFVSRETEAMYILTIHLKGYKRKNLEIDINEGGTLIAIKGERRVKETVIVGWKVYNKDAEIRGFKKVFGIPKGVILDKINAKFNEDESSLTITMPKEVKGIIGKIIEEIEQKNEIVEDDLLHQDNIEKSESRKGKEIIEDFECGTKGRELYSPKHDLELARGECSMTKQFEQDERNENDSVNNIRHDENENERFAVEAFEGSTVDGPKRQEEKNWGGKLKICTPIVAGSALLLSFVVFVIKIVRNQNKKKN